MEAALFDGQPAPLELRLFLLATGERGLGFETVRQFSLHEFETYWMIQQAVLAAANEDSRRDYQRTRAVQRAIALEHESLPPPTAVDVERMSPAELERWLQQMGAP